MDSSPRAFVASDSGVVAALSLNGVQATSFDFDDRAVGTFHFDGSDKVRDLVSCYHPGQLVGTLSVFQSTVRDIAKRERTRQIRKGRQ